jgi:hypothetical protein
MRLDAPGPPSLCSSHQGSTAHIVKHPVGARRESSAKRGPKYTIGVLTKALDLLDVLDDQPVLSLTELSRRAGVNKITAFRILANLEQPNSSAG